MLDLSNFKSFLNAFNIDILNNKEDNYFIFDSNSKKVTELEKKEDSYVGTLEKDGNTYGIEINNDYLIINLNSIESITLNKDSFTYRKLKDDTQSSDFNEELVKVTPRYLNFYSQKMLYDNEVFEYSLKIYDNFQYMKIAKTLKGDGISKRDTVIEDSEAGCIKKDIRRNYGSDGKLINEPEIEETDTDKDDVVKDLVLFDSVVDELYSKLEEFSSGIPTYLKSNYPNFNSLFKNRCYVKTKKSS